MYVKTEHSEVWFILQKDNPKWQKCKVQDNPVHVHAVHGLPSETCRMITQDVLSRIITLGSCIVQLKWLIFVHKSLSFSHCVCYALLFSNSVATATSKAPKWCMGTIGVSHCTNNKYWDTYTPWSIKLVCRFLPSISKVLWVSYYIIVYELKWCCCTYVTV